MKKVDFRPTIGLLTDWSENPYQTTLRAGVVDTAEEHDVNLICFNGGALEATTQYESQRNHIYTLINKKNIDGLVVSSAAIGHYITPEKLKEFCKRFYGIPITSIALSLENIPSVLVDNTRGMQDMLDHLILQHNYRRLAFISGPEYNPEAANRLHIFRESLKKYDIPFREELFVAGDFIFQTGMDAVRILLDERNRDFDAIVAANDEMARGALAELQNRGCQVPGAMAVVGFDDIEESQYYSPSLTTVRQPLYEQGKKATELLLEIIAGKEVPTNVFLDTELVVRESCGCLTEELMEFTDTPQEKICVADFCREFESVKISVITELEQGYHARNTAPIPEDESGWPEELTEAFFRELCSGEKGAFLQSLNSFLYRLSPVKESVRRWQTILSLFRRTCISRLEDSDLISRAESLWHRARIMVSEIGHRLETRKLLQNARENQFMRDLAEKLITKIELAPLLDIVETELPGIGIPSCYLSLYEKSRALGPENARLILAYNSAGRLLERGAVFNYPACELIPRTLAGNGQRFTMILEALFHGDEQLGFVLFEMGPGDGRVYETLRLRLSSALRGTLLFKQLQQQAENLELKIEERTADLRGANSRLQSEITDRKYAEEELKRSNQELEQFAYIASHDLQEPLRMIGSFVGLLARRYQGQLDSNADEYIEFVVDGVNRMKNMINDLLAYSRVRTRAREKVESDFSLILAEAIQALQMVIDEKKAVITYDHLPVLKADALQIRQLLQNLLSNALKFHAQEPPRIHVGYKPGEKEAVIFVRDNGIGLDSEYKDNIFIMFKRLHARDEYPGTGIGLAICKKIVELHDGQIWVDSTVGTGSTFYFSIPK